MPYHEIFREIEEAILNWMSYCFTQNTIGCHCCCKKEKKKNWQNILCADNLASGKRCYVVFFLLFCKNGQWNYNLWNMLVSNECLLYMYWGQNRALLQLFNFCSIVWYTWSILIIWLIICNTCMSFFMKLVRPAQKMFKQTMNFPSWSVSTSCKAFYIIPFMVYIVSDRSWMLSLLPRQQTEPHTV